MTLAAYTFDRVGHVFKPGLDIIPSIAPLVLVIIPLVIALVALAAIEVTERRRAKEKASRPKPTFEDDGNHVVNPLNTDDGVRVRERHRRSVSGQRRQESGNLENNNNVGGGGLEDHAMGGSLRTFARRLFRVETSVETDEDEENEATDEDSSPTGVVSRVCLRYPWQRRWWSAMKGSHELLAIFTGRRKPGMGPSERLVIFIGCFYVNMLGTTIMFHQYVEW